MITATRFRDEHRPAHAIAEFDEREQHDIVDDGADAAVWHETAETEDFRVLVTDERRQHPLLREGHHSVHELAESPLVVQRIRDGRYAVQDEPLDRALLDG